MMEEQAGEPQKLRRGMRQKLTWGRDSKHRLLHSYASLCLPSSFRERAFRKSARMFSLSRPNAFSLSSSAFSYFPCMEETTLSQHSKLTPLCLNPSVGSLSRNIKARKRQLEIHALHHMQTEKLQ